MQTSCTVLGAACWAFLEASASLAVTLRPRPTDVYQTCHLSAVSSSGDKGWRVVRRIWVAVHLRRVLGDWG